MFSAAIAPKIGCLVGCVCSAPIDQLAPLNLGFGRRRREGEVPSHEYQLVFQLPASCPLTSLDFEDDIAEVLGNPRDDKTHPHLVDGNSYGGDTIEFFIHTADPHAAFELCKPLLASAGLLGTVVAAYRRFTEDSFAVIWPAWYTSVFRP